MKTLENFRNFCELFYYNFYVDHLGYMYMYVTFIYPDGHNHENKGASIRVTWDRQNAFK